MSRQHILRPTQLHDHQSRTPSPLRHAFYNASSDSLNHPSRTGTATSQASLGRRKTSSGYKRGIGDLTPGSVTGSQVEGYRGDAGGAYKSVRQSLRPLAQAPVASSPSPAKVQLAPVDTKYTASPRTPTKMDSGREGNFVNSPSASHAPRVHLTAESSHARSLSAAVSRSDSVRAPVHDRSTRHGHRDYNQNGTPHLERSELQVLSKSATGHLRTISKYAEDASEEEFSITSPEQAVVGLHGRRKLQRGVSTKGTKHSSTSSWSGSRWMDQQRQYLQAYEYLCHIGEAKEWMEDIIGHPVPRIVELEEALRDGVVLAEVVQALNTDKKFRIFRNEKLQFRHSDNIAIFFRYLTEIDLPDLFRFELVDLYEKKNIPKVIYCIHALSWLLFRQGIVDFRIGNLVGQLQFENHELEAMQKGLDKAGINMPNFSGMGANFGADLGAEPEESDAERIDRELFENEEKIVDLQAQVKGALLRLRLGEIMQGLWDSEDWLIDMQSCIRANFARQVIDYRMFMRMFAIKLQSVTRGFMVRQRHRKKKSLWRGLEGKITVVQSVVRARQARIKSQLIRVKLQRHERGLKKLQAAIHGATKRRDVADVRTEAQETGGNLLGLQTVIRGALARKRVDDQYDEIQHAEVQVLKLQTAIRGAVMRLRLDEESEEVRMTESVATVKNAQALARGMLQRRYLQVEKTTLGRHERSFSKLQAAARASTSRAEFAAVRGHLHQASHFWIAMQSTSRAKAVRQQICDQLHRLTACGPIIRDLQSVTRGVNERRRIAQILEKLATTGVKLTRLQSFLRGSQLRGKHTRNLEAITAQTTQIIALQAMARGYNYRQVTYEILCALHDGNPEVITLQSCTRAYLLRGQVGKILTQLEDTEQLVVGLQAAVRGNMVRAKFVEKRKFYRQNMEKVIKIQSFVRAKQQGEAYKSLTSGKNPPVGTVKNFVHLLNDSDFDFDEEMGE